ncbi:MAG: hypothetical protein Q4F56_03015, partial [Candidatus Saccharibacteria bacterium]|nr:hypothetical protein [Candidatus Saccharibacteria bacterium]
EDVIEEIGRLNGFDNIPKTLASRPCIGAKLDPMFSLKTQIRDVMADELDAHEVLTYSFVSRDLQEKVLEKSAESYEIVNSLSPELQVFRQSLVPSLLEKTYDNLKAGYKDFALFEMNQVTSRKLGLDEDGVPKMENHLAMVVVGNYYEAKVRLERLIERLSRKMWIAEAKENPGYFEGKRTGDIYVGETLEKARKVGAIGEIKNSVRRKMKLGPTVAAVEISLDALLETRVSTRKAVRVSRFPMVGRDVTVKVKTDVAYEVVKGAIVGGLIAVYARKMTNKKDEAVNLLYEVEPKSIYEKGDGYKNISFHVEFSDMKRTLGEKEIKELMSGIEKKVKEVKGEII